MKKNTSKETTLVITLGFMLLHIVLGHEWLLYLAFIVGLIGATSDRIAVQIEWFWFKLAHILSKIVPTVLLSLVFYLVLTPFSLLSRIFTNDPLLLKNTGNTTFHDVKETDVKKSLEKVW